MQVDISYLDTIEGGTGSARMDSGEVPKWLSLHKGYLIREMRPLNDLSAQDEWRAHSQKGWHELYHKAYTRC